MIIFNTSLVAYLKVIMFNFIHLGGILRGSRRDRLLCKFVENEYEKIDRLMELYTRYV